MEIEIFQIYLFLLMNLHFEPTGMYLPKIVVTEPSKFTISYLTEEVNFQELFYGLRFYVFGSLSNIIQRKI